MSWFRTKKDIYVTIIRVTNQSTSEKFAKLIKNVLVKVVPTVYIIFAIGKIIFFVHTFLVVTNQEVFNTSDSETNNYSQL